MTTRALAAAVAAFVVLVSGGGCGFGGDDDVDRTAADRARPTTTAAAVLDDGDDGGDGTELETTRDETRSDVALQVSETLSDLGAAEVDGDTVITLPEAVLFAYDEHELVPEAAATLDRIAQAIVYFQDAPVRVAGHTDSHGSEDYNQRLSENRVQSVVDHLVGAGVDGSRITAEGFGETQPVAPNENADGSDDPDGRAQNRRVEIVIEGVDPAEVGG